MVSIGMSLKKNIMDQLKIKIMDKALKVTDLDIYNTSELPKIMRDLKIKVYKGNIEENK